MMGRALVILGRLRASSSSGKVQASSELASAIVWLISKSQWVRWNLRFTCKEGRPLMYDYPTILVARDDGLDCSLVQSLQRNGFHVLEADDWDHLFDVVRVHSRRIHLLLLDAKNMYVYVPILKAHRFWLQILFVEKPVDVDDVLAKVRKLIGSPPSPLHSAPSPTEDSRA